MVLAVTPEKKAMEKLAPEMSLSLPARTSGVANMAMNLVQFMASIRLPTNTPREMNTQSFRRGKTRPVQSSGMENISKG